MYEIQCITKVYLPNNHTLVAQWKLDVYTITFDGNGGTSPIITLEVLHGNEIGTLPVPTLSGKVFDGWFTSANASEGEMITESTILTGDITVYAKWRSSFNYLKFTKRGSSSTITCNSVRLQSTGYYYWKNTSNYPVTVNLKIIQTLYQDTTTTGKAYFMRATGNASSDYTNPKQYLLSGTNGTYMTSHTVSKTVTIQPGEYILIFNQVNSDSMYTAKEETT